MLFQNVEFLKYFGVGTCCKYLTTPIISRNYAKSHVEALFIFDYKLLEEKSLWDSTGHSLKLRLRIYQAAVFCLSIYPHKYWFTKPY